MGALPSRKGVRQVPCLTDVDGDGTVSFTDLLEVLVHWNESTGHPADINGDGVVSFEDLLLVLSAWGPCP